MEIKAIIREIQDLPLDEQFFIMEQTLKSIKKEELKNKSKSKRNDIYENYTNDKNFKDFSISEKSLAADWLSKEDNRWDNLL